MRDDAVRVILGTLLGSVAGLMFNVVASQLTPVFLERMWLAWLIIVLCALGGISLALRGPGIHRIVERGRASASKRFMLGVLGVVGFLIIVGTALWIWSGIVEPCPTDSVCILVAEVVSSDKTLAEDITTDLAEQLREILPGTEFRISVVDAVDSEEQARVAALEHGAILIVWGRVFASTDKLRIHFELTDVMGLESADVMRPLRTLPLLYNPIDDTIECANCLDLLGPVAQRIRIMSHAAAGLAFYAHAQSEEARSQFDGALAYTGQPTDDLALRMAELPVPSGDSLPEIGSALLVYYAGKAALQQGDYAEALKRLEQAAQQNAYDPSAWISIATVYQNWLDHPQSDEAERALQEAEARADALLSGVSVMEPGVRASVLFEQGLVEELRGNFEEAANHYRSAVQVVGDGDATSYLPRLGLARALVGAGNEEQAVAELEIASALVPNAPWAFMELAELQAADRRRAEQLLRKAERTNSGLAFVHARWAELCAGWQDYSCAESRYNQAEQLRPNSGWLQSRIGDFYRPTNPPLQHQSWEKADAYYSRAVELRQNDPWSHERLAYVRLSRGSYADAVEQYEHTIELAYEQKTPSRVYCNLGLAKYRNKDFRSAIYDFGVCATLSSTDAEKAYALDMVRQAEASIK